MLKTDIGKTIHRLAYLEAVREPLSFGRSNSVGSWNVGGSTIYRLEIWSLIYSTDVGIQQVSRLDPKKWENAKAHSGHPPTDSPSFLPAPTLPIVSLKHVVQRLSRAEPLAFIRRRNCQDSNLIVIRQRYRLRVCRQIDAIGE